MLAHPFNPSTHETESGRSQGVQGQPGLQSEFHSTARETQRNPVSKNKQKKKKEVLAFNLLIKELIHFIGHKILIQVMKCHYHSQTSMCW